MRKPVEVTEATVCDNTHDAHKVVALAHLRGLRHSILSLGRSYEETRRALVHAYGRARRDGWSDEELQDIDQLIRSFSSRAVSPGRFLSA